MGVEQHSRRTRRPRPAAEHGRLPAVDLDGLDLVQARAIAAVPRPRPRCARRCAAAAGSADTDGMRTNRSSACADARENTARRRTGGRRPASISSAYIVNSAAKRSVISITRWSSGCRTMIIPSPITLARQSRRGAPTGSRSMSHDRVAELGEQPLQPFDVVIRPAPCARLKMLPTLYWRSSGWLQPAVHDGLGPPDVQVAVGGVVHQVDDAGARRTRTDLAEDDLAVGLAIPLHVGEAGP